MWKWTLHFFLLLRHISIFLHEIFRIARKLNFALNLLAEFWVGPFKFFLAKNLEEFWHFGHTFFGTIFAPRPHIWQYCTFGLKTILKLLVHVLAIMANSYLKIVISQKSGVTPPPFKKTLPSADYVICERPLIATSYKSLAKSHRTLEMIKHTTDY